MREDDYWKNFVVSIDLTRSTIAIAMTRGVAVGFVAKIPARGCLEMQDYVGKRRELLTISSQQTKNEWTEPPTFKI